MFLLGSDDGLAVYLPNFFANIEINEYRPTLAEGKDFFQTNSASIRLSVPGS